MSNKSRVASITLIPACLWLGVATVRGQDFSVQNNADSGPGSLRQAIINANGYDGPAMITFAPNVGTINLQSALPVITNSMTISGSGSQNNTISGSGQNQIFSVNVPNGSVSIGSLTLTNGVAAGGSGGSSGGGGGAGLGGALFVNAGNVTVTAVDFAGNTAVGGSGGGSMPNENTLSAGGGGGGLGGSGGNGGSSSNLLADGGTGGGGGGVHGHGGNGTVDTGTAGGGGGFVGNGQSGSPSPTGAGDGGGNNGGRGETGGGAGSPPLNGQNGGTGGGGSGGGSTSNGGNGGAGGNGAGGGGGGRAAIGANGGNGGFGGGGGGGGGASQGANGGNGGFGGGGGGGGTAAQGGQGGAGGFGGGGGGGGGQGGLGGGAGGSGVAPTNGGGGGAGFGGAVFVRPENGASLTVYDSSFTQNSVSAGLGTNGGGNGLAAGSAIFLGGGNLNLSVSNGLIQTIDGSIAQAGPASLTKLGQGTLILTGDNGGPLGYTGGTTVSQGTLLVNNTTGTGLGFGPVNVLSAATLGGTGSISGSVQLADGSHLVLNIGGAGALTFGSDLTLSHNTILDYTPSLTTIPVEVAGKLTLDGVLDINASPSLTPGTYRLFDFGTIDSQGLTLANAAPAGLTYSVDVDASDHQVDLVVTADSTVPEPSSWMVIGLCAASALAFKHRERKNDLDHFES
jgi:hypothetical protein